MKNLRDPLVKLFGDSKPSILDAKQTPALFYVDSRDKKALGGGKASLGLAFVVVGLLAASCYI